MIELKEALAIARKNNEGLIIEEYRDSGSSYIFLVITPNGMDGSAYYYEVNKETGEHRIFSDYWYKLMTDPEFGKAVKDIYKITIEIES